MKTRKKGIENKEKEKEQKKRRKEEKEKKGTVNEDASREELGREVHVDEYVGVAVDIETEETHGALCVTHGLRQSLCLRRAVGLFAFIHFVNNHLFLFGFYSCMEGKEGWYNGCNRKNKNGEISVEISYGIDSGRYNILIINNE